MRRHVKLIVGMTSALGLLAGGAVAGAQTPQTVDHPGPGAGGTDEDGLCEEFLPGDENDPVPAEGNQIWQFNLTPQQNPEDGLLTAEFDDTTTVTDQPADRVTQSGLHFFFVETSEGAALISASATFTGDDPDPAASRLIVSHCIAGDDDGDDGTTTTTEKDTTTTTTVDETTTTTVEETTTTTTGPSAVEPPAPPAAEPAAPVPAEPSFVG